MIEKSEAYILKKYDLTESSYVVHFFTREFGAVKLVAKGAKRNKSNFRGSLEILNLLDIEFSKKEQNELGILRKVELIESSYDLFSDYQTAKYLFVISEILSKGVKENLKEDEIFRLIGAVIKSYKDGVDGEWLFNYFLLWFLKLNGVFPSPFICGKCRRKKEVVSFDSDEGGFLCAKCKTRDAIDVDDKMVEAIKEILEHHPGEFKDKNKKEFPKELKNMLYFNTYHFLGSDVFTILKG